MAKRRKSLKTRFTVVMFAGILVIAAIITVTVQSLVYDSLKKELISRGQAIGESLAKSTASLISERDRVLLNQRVNDVAEFEAVSYVIIEDDSNRVLSDTFGLNTPAELRAIQRTVDIGVRQATVDTLVTYSFQGNTFESYEILSPVEEGIVGYVRIGMFKNYIDSEIEKTIISVLITIGVSVIFAIILAYLLVKSITKPIVFLTESADQISMGSLNASVNVDREDEIGDLANAIERMRESLKAAIERLRKRQSMRV